MTKRCFRYIAWHYLKNFLILLAGLSLAVVLIDLLQNGPKIHGGVNRKILYAFYTWEYMLVLIYPLVILLALAWTQIGFIYRNVFVSLFSFGYSRRQLLLPFLTVAGTIYLTFLILQATPFAYGRDQAHLLLQKNASDEKVRDLFFKYNGDFVYVKQLDPLKKRLYEGMIFHLERGRVVETIRFPLASFASGRWTAPRATVRKKRFDREGMVQGFQDRELQNLTVLEGYRPRVFKQIYEGRSLTIQDAVAAWRLLASQGLSADKVKAILYNELVMPLFALGMLVILFFRTPPYHRFIRKDQLWVRFLGSSLLVWALLFALYRLGFNGTIDLDFGQSLVVLLLILYALKLYGEERRSETHLPG
jgi:lipopolysaccharide export system permease protein